MPVTQALNPRRIARSIVTVLLLTLVQTVAAPILSPLTQAERADAAPVSVAYASNTTGFNVIVPAGVFSITLTARGAAGGKGGNDASAGLASTNVGSVSGTFAVTPGDRIAIYPGGTGGGGADGAKNSGGGTAGSTSVYVSGGTLTPTLRFNSIATAALIANGGTGGNAGIGGTSGAGGGGGAATIIAINDNVALVAGGGGGGGGGSGPGAQPWNGTHVANGTNPAGANGLYGGDCGNTDGGGSGGGGGGWYGGAAGTVDRPGGTGECRAFSGSAGGNFLGNSATSTSNGYVAANGAGEGTYDFIYSATTSCATVQQTSDIYTIVKVTTTAECTWAVPSTVNVLDLFLVGGGGGGAGDAGPGGGGGATLSRSAIVVSPSSTMRLKVGFGGAGGGWGYVGSSERGDSTTVVTSTGSVFYALGGTRSDNGPSTAVTGNQTVQSGSFDGGIGGTATPNSNTVGGIGKPGVSNYFYGSQNTYAGGGGGGCYFGTGHNVSVAGALGSHGGGSGCSYDVTTKNTNGGNGTAGTGGGGGGGGAGDAFRTVGGKGGSGVILIRYATNAADAFPASLTSALAARWNPSDLQLLDSTRKGWIDSSGTNSSVTNAGFISGAPTITNQGITDAANSTGSTKTLLAATGGVSDKITLKDLPTGYTLFHVARYASGGTTGRIMAATSGSWLSGFWNGYDGVTYHNNWLTDPYRAATQYKWVLSSDRNTVYRANGKDVTYDAQNIATQTTSTGFGINNFYAENSTWQVADVIVFNRELSPYENRLMESYLARVNGLTLTEDATSSETDTAGTFNATNYYYTQYNYGNNLNDTFTVEAWIKASPTCASVECTFFGRELSLVLRAYQGRIWYALYGGSEWEWTDTGINIGYNEWHHFAITKRLVGNNSGSMDYYLDGQYVGTKPGNPYRAGSAAAATISDNTKVNQQNTWTYLGLRYIDANNYWYFYGALDEFKVWKVARTAADIAADMHSSDPTSPNLQMYYDFNKSVSSSNTFQVPNLGNGGPLRADLIPSGTATYTDVKVVSQSGPYTTITFPRTYITQTGGWKVPSDIRTASAIVVGGGGGGGFGSATNRPAGGGGGGGVTASLTQNFTPGATVSVKVGAGGLGGFAADDASVRNGQSSTLGVGAGLVALGGGGGGNNGGNGAGGSTVATGGGSGASSYTCTGSPPTPSGSLVPGATVTSGNNGGGGIWGWGGSGGGARGAATNGVCSGINAGVPGPGFVDPITSIEYGRGGSADAYSATSLVAGNTTQNNGWGGVISYSGGNSTGVGYRGSSGTVVIRYITAAKPTYTKPSNAYLNVGMTETFTTNVAVDSATVRLTRTFRWESTTAGVGGTYSPIKIGTGAANAAFAWVPSDTSTSGSQYLYRVVVTDSDTAGLFIQDTSTAVFATINPALNVSSSSLSNTLAKTINVSRSETFTITLGTSTYRPVLSPVIKGITLDTSTAGSAVLRISDTATVGTYFETLTVTDSVSATFVIPLTIKVQGPPSLTDGGEIVTDGQVLNLDAGNSRSILLADGTVATSVVWNDISGAKSNATTSSAIYNSTTCNPPTYSTDNGGILNFSGAGTTCYQTPYLGTQFTKSYTIEAWVKLSSAMTSGMQIISQAYSVQYDNIAMAIGGLDQGIAGAIFVGFYDGSAWRLTPNGYTPTLNTWFHIAGTYDGANMNTYINGSLFSTVAWTGGATTQNSKGFYVGKRWDGSDSAYYFSGSIGEVRAYNRALSAGEVSQNFNGTKFRYTASYAQKIVKPAQKYGALNLESFTVTSGGDTKTVSLAVGNRSGIAWDTATAGVIKLSVQESLTPGTYYDTLTITDNFAVTTTLPLKFTISKADTITVYIDTPTALSYTASKAILNPVTKTLGLVGIETGTTLNASYNFKPGGTTCANGGYCRVGDVGPGGGIVFIDTSTAGGDGRYYEAAPQNWTGTDDLASAALWCSDTTSNFYFSITTIGWGETLTPMATSSCGVTSAIGQVSAYRGGGYSNWYMPNRGEAQQMINNRDAIGLIKVGANWASGNYGYWTVNDSPTASMVFAIRNDGASWTIGYGSRTDSTRLMVRPIRAFTSCWLVNACTSLATTDTPTAAGVHNIVPLSVPNSADLLSKYTAISFVTTNLTINRISQNRQTLPILNTNYPDTLTVNVLYGSGNGALTYSVINGTATGCALDYKKLYSTTQGTCNIQVVKAGDRNYLPDTATASILFLLWVLNQPTNQVGSGSTIALNGVTSFETSTVSPPSITSLSSTLLSLGSGGTFTITGTGFNAGGLTVKFWRNKYVTPSGTTATTITFNVSDIGLSGASSGRIAVTTVNGEVVSVDSLTITP